MNYHGVWLVLGLCTLMVHCGGHAAGRDQDAGVDMNNESGADSNGGTDTDSDPSVDSDGDAGADTLVEEICNFKPTRTYRVDGQGDGDFLTIQEAMQAVLPGEAVVINGGNYDEQVEVDGLGSKDAPIIIMGAPDETVVVNAQQTRGFGFYVTRTQNVCFKNITVKNAVWAGFYVVGPADGLVLDGIVALDNQNDSPVESWGSGIILAGDGPNSVENCVVKNCFLSGNRGNGLVLSNRTYNILVKNNRITQTGFLGDTDKRDAVSIAAWDDAEQAPEYISVVNNQLDNATRQGLNTWNVNHIVVRDNWIHHNGASGIQIEDGTHDFVVEGNLCEWNQQVNGTETGIWIDDASRGVVQNNVVRHEQVGIKLSKNKNVIVRHNLIYNNRRENRWHNYNGGIVLLAYSGVNNEDTIVVHNTIDRIGNPDFSTNRGIAIMGTDMGDDDTAFSMNSVFFNNVVANLTSGFLFGIVDDEPPSSYSSNYNNYYADSSSFFWFDEILSFEDYRLISGQEGNSVFESPRFVNQDLEDYTLMWDSPCIDSGSVLTRTRSAGEGREIPVVDARFFADGLGLIPGDLIWIGKGNSARVEQVDYVAHTLLIDKTVIWQDNTPVGYPYLGDGPDMGGIESF